MWHLQSILKGFKLQDNCFREQILQCKYATTSVIIDPKEDMISILLSQMGPAILPVWHQFQTLVYQAVVD